MTAIAIVFALGLITALATGLGAVPFALIKSVQPRAIARANAVASGLMLGACFELLVEGTSYGTWQTIAGGAIGVAAILAGHRLFDNSQLSIGSLRGADARQVTMVLVVMTLHSFSEGIAVGVSFGGGERLAALITAAIAVHNIPEGLAISAVMRPRGTSVAGCAWWSIFSSLPQPLMAVPAYLFVGAVRPVLPYGLGFAAGAMVFMVFLELMPEAYEKDNPSTIGVLVSVSLAAMLLVQQFL